MRLWLLVEIKQVEDGLRDLLRVMVERADKEKEYLRSPAFKFQSYLTAESVEFVTIRDANR